MGVSEYLVHLIAWPCSGWRMLYDLGSRFEALYLTDDESLWVVSSSGIKIQEGMYPLTIIDDYIKWTPRNPTLCGCVEISKLKMKL